MISAATELDSVVRCIELGAEDYLPKPFNRVLLRARIGASLERKRLHDREAAHLAEIERQRRRADELLHAILPAPAVRELKASQVGQRQGATRTSPCCSATSSGSPPFASATPPEEVVANLDRLVGRSRTDRAPRPGEDQDDGRRVHGDRQPASSTPTQ